MNDPLSFRSRSVLLALVALLQVGCERPTAPPSDVTPPAVALASPAGDTVVSAASLTLSGTLTDSVGVRQATCELNEGRARLAITPGASAQLQRHGHAPARAEHPAGPRLRRRRKPRLQRQVGVTMDTLPPAHLPLPARRIAGTQRGRSAGEWIHREQFRTSCRRGWAHLRGDLGGRSRHLRSQSGWDSLLLGQPRVRESEAGPRCRPGRLHLHLAYRGRRARLWGYGLRGRVLLGEQPVR